MAREALAVTGAVVGAWLGGPVGAQIGFQIGNYVGGRIDPDIIPHPGLNDAPIQTSRDGIPIAIILGLQYCHGNILQKNPEEVVTTTTRQGKGGGTEVEEKTRYRTFAIGICEGPIAEVTRIWENNKLVYDNRSSPAIPVAESTKYAEGFTLYKGDESQLPDPELEAHWTTAETPAYRGLAYIVFNSKDLTDTGGAIPQFAFEVNGSRDATVTSKPYPIEALDGITLTVTPQDGYDIGPPIEGINLTVAPQDGTLVQPYHLYDYETEGVDLTVTPQDGTLAVKIESYTYEEEGADLTVTPQDGTLETRLISYSYEEEGVELTVTPKNGTLV